MAKRNTFVGLDVHKESITVAIAESGRLGEVRSYGTIGGDLAAVDRLRGVSFVTATAWSRSSAISSDSRTRAS